MTGAAIEIEVWGDGPLARLVRPALDVIAVSEIERAVAAGRRVAIAATETPGEPFDDRPACERGYAA